MCLRGVSELYKKWLKEDESAEVAVYVVWSTQLGAEEHHVPEATNLIPDSRVRHYWDPGLVAGRAFQPIVGTAAAAWDVWLLFDKETVWEGDAPPEPAWWEHQLQGMPGELRLDPDRFAEKARKLLNKPGSRSAEPS